MCGLYNDRFGPSVGPGPAGRVSIRDLDGGEHKANNPAWTTAIASPCIRTLSSGSRAGYARGAALIGWQGSQRSSALRSACATSRNGSPTIVFGAPRRAASAASRVVACICRTLSKGARRTGRQRWSSYGWSRRNDRCSARWPRFSCRCRTPKRVKISRSASRKPTAR
jgi:hypothetical protein